MLRCRGLGLVCCWLCVEKGGAFRGVSSFSKGQIGFKFPMSRPSAENGNNLMPLRAQMGDESQDVEIIDEKSSIALVAGTTIGAGVLALPNVSYEVGFVPSVFALVGSWIVMSISSLLIAEVGTNLAKEDSKFEGKSFLTLVGEVLGDNGGKVATFIYIVLHYALLVAYDAGAGDAFSRALNIDQGPTILLFGVAMGTICGFGGEGTINSVNNFMFAVVCASFGALIGIGFPAVNPSNLIETFHPERLFNALPVMVLAFVHHNVIPTVSRQLAYNKQKQIRAVIVGTSVPLIIFLMWNFVVLGIGPIQSIDSTEAFTDRSSFDTVGVLASVGGGENGGIVATELAELFSAAAIITSFIGFFVGLSDLLRDFVTPEEDSKDSSGYSESSSLAIDLGIALAITGPPALVAIQNPSIFISALDIAGTYGITLLFLVMPAVMSIVLKRRMGEERYDSFVPLGNLPAVACICTSVALILQKVTAGVT